MACWEQNELKALERTINKKAVELKIRYQLNGFFCLNEH